MPINTATITPASLKAKEVATEDYVDSAVSNVSIDDATWQTKVQQALDSDTTTIDGAKITTGSINANRLGANIGEMGILYNIGGNSDTYTMMINFNTGEIHIK